MVKNLILWLVIAMILLSVFKNFSQPIQQQTMSYSQFIEQVQSDQVEAIQIEGDPEHIAEEQAKKIETEYDKEKLIALVNNNGRAN